MEAQESAIQQIEVARPRMGRTASQAAVVSGPAVAAVAQRIEDGIASAGMAAVVPAEGQRSTVVVVVVVAAAEDMPPFEKVAAFFAEIAAVEGEPVASTSSREAQSIHLQVILEIPGFCHDLSVGVVLPAGSADVAQEVVVEGHVADRFGILDSELLKSVRVSVKSAYSRLEIAMQQAASDSARLRVVTVVMAVHLCSHHAEVQRTPRQASEVEAVALGSQAVQSQVFAWEVVAVVLDSPLPVVAEGWVPLFFGIVVAVPC